MTSHAAKYHFSEDKECSTDGAEVAVGFKETSFCLKSSSLGFFSSLHSFLIYIQLFCSFFIFIWKSMSGHTLKAAQTVSTSQYKCTDSAKLQLKSVHKQSVKLLIFFFFLDFIQCHLYTTKSPIYYYISFFKKEPHGAPQYCGSRRKKIDHIRRVSERVDHTSSLSVSSSLCFPARAVFGHRRLSFIKDKKVPAHVHACPSVLFPTVSEFGDMLMRNQRKVTCFALSC